MSHGKRQFCDPLVFGHPSDSRSRRAPFAMSPRAPSPALPYAPAASDYPLPAGCYTACAGVLVLDAEANLVVRPMTPCFCHAMPFDGCTRRRGTSGARFCLREHERHPPPRRCYAPGHSLRVRATAEHRGKRTTARPPRVAGLVVIYGYCDKTHVTRPGRRDRRSRHGDRPLSCSHPPPRVLLAAWRAFGSDPPVIGEQLQGPI
jgi:hypothetical protein